VVGCDAVVAGGGDDVVGCDDIVQTGELEVDVEYNVRLVEVSEDNVVCFENDHQGEADETGSNSEANTMKPKNRDKGTCTNICIVLLSTFQFNNRCEYFFAYFN
jgi:hypothetical protein